MKTFPALYIDSQGVIRYNLFPEEPKYIEKASDGCLNVGHFNIETQTYDYNKKVVEYRKALTSAKDSAIELESNYPNAKELFDCLKALGVDPVQAPKWLNERKGQVIPLPSGWKVERKEECQWNRNTDRSIPTNADLDYVKVAVLIPPPTSEQEESQEEIWEALFTALYYECEMTANTFTTDEMINKLKETFTITRRKP